MKIFAAQRMETHKPQSFASVFGDIFAQSQQPTKQTQVLKAQKAAATEYQKIAKLRGITDAIIDND